MAASGRLGAGDMVQRPGADEWHYAAEIPELSSLLDQHDTMEDEDVSWRPRRSVGLLGTAAIVVLLLGTLAIGSLAMVFFYTQLPDPEQGLLSEAGLSFSEMLVTQPSAPLLREPSPTAGALTALGKDTKLTLLAKRGDYYRAQTPDGQIGWIAINQVLPMYLMGGGEVMAEHDPLYNPDDYVEVTNATWLQIDQKNAQMTVFRFMLENESRYPMTDLVLLCTIKDSKGTELERVEIPVEGIIPPGEITMVGTLLPESGDNEGVRRSLTTYSFGLMAEEDPDLRLQWSDGVEVEMGTENFTEATVDLLEVRAVPKG